MPILEVTTNVDPSKLTLELIPKASEIVASVLGKQKDGVIAVFSHQPILGFGVPGEPGEAAIVHLTSIGKIDRETNAKFSAAFADFLAKELGIANNRFYIVFHDAEKHNIGYKRTTVADLWEEMIASKTA